jgi:hypothetical protein
LHFKDGGSRIKGCSLTGATLCVVATSEVDGVHPLGRPGVRIVEVDVEMVLLGTHGQIEEWLTIELVSACGVLEGELLGELLGGGGEEELLLVSLEAGADGTTEASGPVVPPKMVPPTDLMLCQEPLWSL